MVVFKRNIFISDPEFYYYRSTYPVFDITLKESTSYVARNNRANREPTFAKRVLQTTDAAGITGAKEMELNPPSISYFFPVEHTNSVKLVDHSHLTCISNNNGKWVSNFCDKSVVLDVTNRTLGIECACLNPEPVTLVDDVDNMYKSADSSLLVEIANNRFNVALEPLFYAFLFFTFDYVILMIWAYFKDSADAADEPVKVVKRQLTKQ